MTEKRRLQAAEKFRSLLDNGTIRKAAILAVCKEFAIDRATLYRYCARFGISTA